MRWTGRRLTLRWFKRLLIALVVAALLLGVVFAVISFVRGTVVGSALGWATQHKKHSGFGGDILSNVFFTVAPLVIGLGIFLAWRYRRVPARYVRKAKASPIEFVETAGNIVGEVVGRDHVCNVLQSELRDPATRRPHVLVGGLGEGKTALLVQLTNLLSRRGAVPVPVHLRAAKEEIDFLALARERFLNTVKTDLRSESEGDRVWRQLLRDDRIIVLADGLEEAFADEDEGRARHHRVRVAISSAAERKFPLIVASRPHDALRALDAALVHVEPLSEDAALEHVRGSEPALADAVADRLIDTAQITEAPLYMRIAHELHDEDLLEQVVAASRDDRGSVRCALLGAWLEALVTRSLGDTREVAMDEAERRAVVEHLSALACVALRDDTQEIRFDEYELPVDATARPQFNREDIELHKKLTYNLNTELQRRLDTMRSGPRSGRAEWGTPIVEIQAAASKGLRLNLVEPRTNGVRFPHSVMQSYLAARILTVAIATDGYLDRALRTPGRELLLALVMFSRIRPQDDCTQWYTRVCCVRDKLIGVIDETPESKRLDVIAAALDIDTELKRLAVDDPQSVPAQARSHVGGRQTHDVFARTGPVEHWRKIKARDLTTTDSKRLLITRLGQSARKLEQIGDDVACTAAYECLHAICAVERDYSLRLAAAQEIGNGGDAAWRALRGELDLDPTPDWEHWSEILAGTRSSRFNDADAEESERRYAEWAWLLPMLLGTVAEDTAREAVDKRLRNCLRCSAAGTMPLSLEAALAQGFKHAANRRPHHSQENAASRALLQRRAGEMIYQAQFWYSRLALLHALCLWQLSRIAYPGSATPERAHDPRGLVAGWLKRKETGQEDHRFVLEAAELAHLALATGEPWRYLWIDESGVVTKIGSVGKGTEYRVRKSLWISPSAGWMVLDDRARQLVADILILLNLAERGEVAELREQRLGESNGTDLPRCLVDERCTHLKPSQTVGMADMPNPGTACAKSCQVRLCPYPPRGQQPYRVELSEAFCRRQQLALSRRNLLRAASWQEGSRVELRRFWRQMEERARI